LISVTKDTTESLQGSNTSIYLTLKRGKLSALVKKTFEQPYKNEKQTNSGHELISVLKMIDQCAQKHDRKFTRKQHFFLSDTETRKTEYTG
jgi:hypothetical protein